MWYTYFIDELSISGSVVEMSDRETDVRRFSWDRVLRRLYSGGIWELVDVKPEVTEGEVGKFASLRRRKPSPFDNEWESRCSVVEGGEGESTLPTKWTEVVDGPASGIL